MRRIGAIVHGLDHASYMETTRVCGDSLFVFLETFRNRNIWFSTATGNDMQMTPLLKTIEQLNWLLLAESIGRAVTRRIHVQRSAPASAPTVVGPCGHAQHAPAA